jgi:adenylate kinase
MNLPEKLVQDTHNTEEGLSRRLTEYRDNNNEENTVTNFFEEELDLDVIKLAPEVIEDDKSFLHKNVVDMIKLNYMKDTRNYGLSTEEKAELKRAEIEKRLAKEREEREQRERLEAEEAAERVKKQSDWNEKLEQLRKEELEYLETQSEPLRNYLMTHVMPTLTKGLIECCNIRPEDPIDYLVIAFSHVSKLRKLFHFLFIFKGRISFQEQSSSRLKISRFSSDGIKNSSYI